MAGTILALSSGAVLGFRFFEFRDDLEIVSSYLGDKPETCDTDLPAKAHLLSSERTADGVVERYKMKNCAGAVEFLVGLPPKLSARSPVIMALPQTGVAGAREVFGLAGDPNLAYGRAFLKAGFLVVSPDVWINGSGPDASKDWSTDKFYERFPQWSALGRMLEDNRSVFDYIARNRPEAECRAVVGHSLGGHNAIFLSAFDKRVDVTVSSGGFEPIATDEDASRWSRPSWFVYAPALKDVVSAPAPRDVPFDFKDILSTIAPRAVMILQGNDDPVWTNEKLLPGSLQVVEEKYAQLNVSDRFRLVMFRGGHEFPGRKQLKAIKFVTEQCAELANPDP